MKIIISPYSRALRNGKENPKNYPFWPQVVKELKKANVYIVQVGTSGEKEISGVDEVMFGASLDTLSQLIAETDTWISVDNFFQHLAHLQKKPGVVLFGQGNPEIFGHSENTNLLKDKKYLRSKQFDIWEACEINDDAFVAPKKVVKAVLNLCKALKDA